MKKIIFSCLMLIGSLVVNAHDIEVDGIYYNIISSTEPYTVEVTFQGSSYSSYTGEYSGTVVIPETITYNNITYNVTSVGEYAFASCTNLTSVTIGDSVTTIGENSFYKCSKLTDVVISGNVKTIENYVFKSCSSLKNVRFEDGSETLKLGYNYYRATGTMDYISVSANGLFQDCPLETLYLGRNLTYVTSDCGAPFYGKSKLTEVTIGMSVTSIKEECFNGCSGLSSVTIPNSISSIDSNAFYNCTGLKAVNICDIGTWCQIEFANSSSNPLYYAHNLYLDGILLTDIEIPSTINTLKKYVFYGCDSIKSIILHKGVTSIGDYAFYDCNNITNIYAYPILPPSLISNAFSSTTYNNAILYTLEEVATTYKNDKNWQKFVNISATLDDVVIKPVLLVIEYPEGAIIKHEYDYNKTAKLNITPAEEWVINTITFNDEDITAQLDENGNYTTPKLTSDSRISIVIKMKDSQTEIEPLLESDIKVYAKDGIVSILGVDESEESVIYDVKGEIIYKGIDKEISLNRKGVFILSVAEKTFKFIL